MASKQKKPTMKKDAGEKNSRPGTANRGPTKLSAKETAAKLEQLTTDNEELESRVENLTKEKRELKKRLDSLATTLVEDAEIKGYEFQKDDTSLSPNELTNDTLLDIINFLAHRRDKKKKGPVENRIEELETRITHLNMELAKMLKVRLKLENGLDDIQNCGSLEEAKSKARFMMFEAGNILS